VFAPQNLLQDPPFSRLDIVSCRNLLIYLEPEIQHRVIGFLHFGLREGGTLFLGTSETVPNGEQMFETIDKKARLFRRIGPARPGNLDFPPIPSIGFSATAVPMDSRGGQKPSVAALTTKALLAWHVPAAITVNRDGQIAYFHGNTQPYLNQPSGEPTRDLLANLKEDVRGAARTALHRAMSENSTAIVHDGILETGEGRVRIVVTASPLDTLSRSEYFVVSFSQRHEENLPALSPPGNAAEPEPETEAELKRVRHELQMTIEELQTSNEEHKASAEEVMSINEELQSTNEELETSKEEMQSLNEELTTVNAQLQVKIEELQSITSDLSSLLSSTDIAVLFLDTQLRIRRFTPAANKLLGLIASDIGRPLSDMARKFTDPDLLTDAKTVIDSLVAQQKEIAAEEDKWYVRRILPYRTSENRIEGVVITFVEVTDIKSVEAALRRSEENLAAELRVMSKLHDITNRLIVVPNLNAAMDEILAAAIDITGAAMGNLQLLDEETHTLNIAVHRGFKSDFLHSFKSLSKDASTACAVAFREGRRVVVEDVEQDPLYASLRRVAASAGFQAVQSTPLQNRQGRNIGVISTHFKSPYRPTDRALGAMDLLARQAADVIERIKVEDRLTALLRNERTAHETLNEAARMKDEFLATLSHELRTPLSAILLWSKVIRDTPVGQDKQREGIDAIIRNAEAQSRLIEDLVDTSRIATGKLRMEFEGIDIASTLKQSINSIEPTAHAKGVRIVSDISQDLGIVRADIQRLQQVFWNLLTNAVKFTPNKGTVSVTAKRTAETIEIRFADTGIGMEPVFLPHVFDRFLQYDSSNSRKHMGLGLGLAITKELIQLHGGTVEAQSAGPHRGSTFVVRLPMPAIGKLPEIRHSHLPATNKSLQGIRILVLEDDVSTQTVMKLMLTQMGAEVLVTESASLAMQKRSEFGPAVIISDIGLPDMDGHAFIRAIRELEKQEGRAPTISIAVSAFAREEDRQKALAAGFTQYFPKPIDLDMLIHSLVSLAHGQRA
jgi:two-component system CheB/CheR fusion protein